MKKHNKHLFLLMFIASLAVASCNTGPKGEKAEASDAKDKAKSDQNYMVYEVMPAESTIEWLGAKPTGLHNGTISLEGGELRMEEGMLKGGNFKVDMTSIENEDLNDSPEYQMKLVNHLKSADFFDVENYPTATFEITNVKPANENPEVENFYRISGNLTIMDITKNISFNAEVNTNGDVVMASTPQFVIDRTDWGIKYKSKKFFDDLKDKFINDDMGIRIKLKSEKK